MTALLNYYMQPINQLLAYPDLIEISVINNQTIMIETAQQGYQRFNHSDNLQDQLINEFKQKTFFTPEYWYNLCHILANTYDQDFNPPHKAFLSVSLPGGHRFQAKLGSGIESGLDISVRVQQENQADLRQFGLNQAHIDQIRTIIIKGANILISGGTSSGKTTFLKQLINNIPVNKRIITLEDTREIFLKNHKHVLHHTVPRNEGRNLELYGREIDHMMRSRPDYIILGEISIGNTFPMIRLLNSGHAGFMSTIHANSPELAMSAAIPQNIRLAGLCDQGIIDVMKSTFDLIIQLHRHQTQRCVTQLYWPKLNKSINLAA